MFCPRPTAAQDWPVITARTLFMYPRGMENCLKRGEILRLDVLDVTLGVVVWVAR